MTSKIKVDNIENQCGGAVVTKCGGTTTISGTVVKSNTLQASDAGNIISQSGTTITLGASGDTINLASGASQSGFGRTGTVDWITTPKTATFTAVSGEGYFCNTSGGAFTVNLPAGVAGAIVSVADYAATFQTNALTVVPNGTDKIGSTNANATLDTEGQSVTLVYVDATQGWINTMDSTSNVRGAAFICASVSGACNTLAIVDTDYKVATFTGPGTFTVTNAGTPAGSNSVDYMAVAGGGGGGKCRSGGGGAGGYRESPGSVSSYTASPLGASPATAITVTAQGYPIVVGGGGAGGTAPTVPGTNGVNSSAFGITSAGGGGGNSDGGASPDGPGGSGGGGSNNRTAGSGNQPPVSPAQGTNGGPAISGIAGGGGGGAGVAGASGPSPTIAGTGGAGTPSAITGSGVTRGGGGGGGSGGGAGAPGGAGGGGNGVGNGNPTGNGDNGGTNLGGGGGGTAEPGGNGGTGGSGIVIIRYKFQ